MHALLLLAGAQGEHSIYKFEPQTVCTVPQSNGIQELNLKAFQFRQRNMNMFSTIIVYDYLAQYNGIMGM